jgi:hypothetical protein
MITLAHHKNLRGLFAINLLTRLVKDCRGSNLRIKAKEPGRKDPALSRTEEKTAF